MTEEPNTSAEPIIFDPIILEHLNAPGPTLEDIENMTSIRVTESASTSGIETLDELIAELEEYRELFGGDTPVRDWECGTKIHIHGSEYSDGDKELRL